jgi:predicted nucleic acid-binding protein
MTTATVTTGSDRILVDSSGWLEALTGDTKAVPFQSYLQHEPNLLVPTIVIYEVYRKLRNEFSTNAAVRFLSHALRCQVIPLDEDLAVAAAYFGIEHRLHMADAIIYATARAHQVELVTSDEHFLGLPGVTLL